MNNITAIIPHNAKSIDSSDLKSFKEKIKDMILSSDWHHHIALISVFHGVKLQDSLNDTIILSANCDQVFGFSGLYPLCVATLMVTNPIIENNEIDSYLGYFLDKLLSLAEFQVIYASNPCQ